MPTGSDVVLPTERWSSVEEVTEHLGVGRDTIYRWIERKALPAHRIGRLWKFKLSKVDSWVLAQSAASEQQGSKDGRAGHRE
jgi:excisionase family DNA binding protein